MMRVLHVGKFFPPHPGGIERCTFDLSRSLAQRGLQVAVVAHAEPGNPGRSLRTGDGVEVTLAACHGRLLYAPVSPGFPMRLRAAIRTFHPDILHLHLPNTSAFAALLIGAARRLPWVVHWHADIPLETSRRLLRIFYCGYKPFEQALLRCAAAIIATSPAYRDSSAALAPWSAKTHVVPLGIDSDTAEAAEPDSADTPTPPWPRGSVRLLVVGRLSYFKGIDVLLRALVEIPQAALVVVGDGECRADLQQLAGQLAIADRVRFAGRIDMNGPGEAALAALYRSADVFCLPSINRAESFGLVLLEAMRARLPVIASDIPGSGIGLVVRDGETGLLVPPGDIGALAGALRRLAGDADLRQRLGECGLQRWRGEFTLDRQTDQVLEIYRQILGAAPVRAAAGPASSPPPA